MAKINLDESASTKNLLDLSNTSKLSNITWDDAVWSWNDSGGTWDQPEYTLTKVSKSSVDLDRTATTK